MMIVVHGLPKLVGGPERWELVGSAMANFGLGFAPAFWGFVAAATELGGGLALILGLAVRPMSGLLAFTMMVAASTHLAAGKGLFGAAHPIEVGIALLALVLMGGGRFALDAKLFAPRKQTALDTATA